MIYGQKNTNRPMIVLVNDNHIWQGGWYGYQYNDMDVTFQVISSAFHQTRRSDICEAERGMDSLHRQANGTRNAALYVAYPDEP